MKKTFYSSLLLILSLNVAFGQAVPYQVKGKVVSAETGVPLEAAVIKLSSNNTGMLSTKDGYFTIPIAGVKDTIRVSHAGYTAISIPVSNKQTELLVISLFQSTKQLDEVIVNTGYQKIAKERSTGSFTTVSKQLFNQQAGTNVLDRLESITNGLYVDRQTNGSNKIVIRGLSTIQGPRAPLIILDDFPYEGDLNNLNPNEIESITILKDAAAASIWGTRAGNGVIVLTTKKGRYDQPIKVEFSSTALFTSKPDLSYAKDISSTDFIAVERFLYGKGYYNNQLTTKPYLAISPVIELLKQRDLGNISTAEADAAINQIGTYDLRSELARHVYRTGQNFQQSLGVRGGSKVMNWNIHAGWDRNNDVLKAGYQRYNLSSSQSFKIIPKIEATTGIVYTQSQSKSGMLGYGSLRPRLGNLPVYTRLADDNGTALPVFYAYRQSYIDTAGAGKLLNWNWYPLTDQDNVDKTTTEQAILANAGLSYRPVKGLTLAVKYQYGRQVTDASTLYGKDSYFARDLVNQFSSLNRSTGVVTNNIAKGAIYDNSSAVLETQNVRSQADYNRKIGKSEIVLLAGSEYRQIAYNYRSSREYGYDPEILTTLSVDNVTRFPNFLTGDPALIPDGGSFAGTLNRYISLFGNAAYTYKGKYTLTGSIRRDASNLFGASSNNKWTPLWSIGGSWNISKELFYKIAWLPQMKMRMTYGKSGNADPLRSAVTTIQYLGTSIYTQLPTAMISQFENPNLSWETVSMFNAGMDFSSKNNRISGSVEYYRKRGSNLFGTSPVDYTGLANNSIVKNVANISGHGLDIEINSLNVTGSISWRSHFNFNVNKDKVVKYYLTSKQGSNFTNGNSISAIEGNPVFALYNYKWAGLDPVTGDPRGYVNGVISKDYTALTGANTQITDMRYIGPTLPTKVISLGNTVSWKKLSLTLRVTGKFGHYFQRTSIDYSNLAASRVGHPDFTARWQQPGDENTTNIPSMIYPLNNNRETFYRYSEILATKADHIRLQYINLQYDFARPQLQLFFNANNLGLLWTANSFGIDPEYNTNLPPSRNYAAGARINF